LPWKLVFAVVPDAAIPIARRTSAKPRLRLIRRVVGTLYQM
jgi:hypothetical protein